jgi:prolyl oligopeptidase
LEFKPLVSVWKGEFEFLHNVGTKFFYLTNYMAPNKRIISMDINYPQEENWRELLRGDDDTVIEGADFIFGKLIVTFLENGANQIKVYDLTSHEAEAKLLHEVPLPGRGQIEDETSGDSDENFYLFTYQTYTQPTQFYKLDLENYNLETIFDNHFLMEKTGYNPNDYVSDFIHFTSKDGTEVPLSIIRKKEVLPSLD